MLDGRRGVTIPELRNELRTRRRTKRAILRRLARLNRRALMFRLSDKEKALREQFKRERAAIIEAIRETLGRIEEAGNKEAG